MQDTKEPLYNVGDLVTRKIYTSVALVFQVDEILESNDTFFYHLKPYKGSSDLASNWDREDGLYKATRVAPPTKNQPNNDDAAMILKDQRPLYPSVGSVIGWGEVLSGEKSIYVENDNTPALEYRFKPVGAVKALFVRDLDLGLEKSFWHEVTNITDQGLMAECRTVSQRDMRVLYREALDKTEGTRDEAYERLNAAGINSDKMTKAEMIDAAIKLLDKEG